MVYPDGETEEQFFFDIYTRSDAEFRECGADDYLQRLHMTRLDFGLITLPATRMSNLLNEDRFAYNFYRMVIPPGMLDNGFYPPTGNPTLEEVTEAIASLHERRLLRVAQPEDVMKVQEQMNSGVIVFPGVHAPEIGDTIATEAAQGIWIDVFHGLLGYNSDPEVDYETDPKQSVQLTTRPVSKKDCLLFLSGNGSDCENCNNRTKFEYLGPVMDYWWRISPHGYRMTCTLVRKISNRAEDEGKEENKEGLKE
ncbi:MAG: hypothetical protein JWM11_1704 [Planctomycetaceae bacterium]|nr:hypothetical protein [Planctomycetaceae bacterium]